VGLKFESNMGETTQSQVHKLTTLKAVNFHVSSKIS